jgi:hypothetical protein
MNFLMEAFTFDCKHDGEVGTVFNVISTHHIKKP